ncbi:ATP-grasp domain-containing protein [Pseudoalteromonas sp. T1lg23B]|uniref:ATP-grasp domain-containing protein n=1 Tax=Pseudoalteromonas sp. T1lg23B TaxID=2077097 RepID=UPI000CF5EE6E|nr:ATP-grasp domain-containing protein [Pseudoalteromonas sp. T1lg23B]
MRVLVIGTVRQAHQAIVNLEHELVLFINKGSSRPGDVNFPYHDLFLFNEEACSAEYEDVAHALHQHKPFDAICSFNDTTQEIAIAVADRLGLSFPVSMDCLSVLYNKDKTRQVLKQQGLDDTAYAVIESVEALNLFVDQVGGPVIVKPFNATGSSGVTKVHHRGEIDGALRWLKQCGHDFPVIAEEFLLGDEFSIEAISENGKHCILAITKKIKDEVNFVELGHVLPAPIDDAAKEAISTFVRDALDALGLRDGPSHTEVMLTPNGPRIIETHSRAGGDRIFELLELATGINVLEMTVRQATGEQVLPLIEKSMTSTKVAAIRFAAMGFDDKTRLSSVENLEQAREIPGIVEVSLMKSPGDVMGAVTNSFARSALAIAVANDAEQALAQCQQALDTLKYNLSWEQK